MGEGFASCGGPAMYSGVGVVAGISRPVHSAPVLGVTVSSPVPGGTAVGVSFAVTSAVIETCVSITAWPLLAYARDDETRNLATTPGNGYRTG